MLVALRLGRHSSNASSSFLLSSHHCCMRATAGPNRDWPGSIGAPAMQPFSKSGRPERFSHSTCSLMTKVPLHGLTTERPPMQCARQGRLHSGSPSTALETVNSSPAASPFLPGAPTGRWRKWRRQCSQCSHGEGRGSVGGLVDGGHKAIHFCGKSQLGWHQLTSARWIEVLHYGGFHSGWHPIPFAIFSEASRPDRPCFRSSGYLQW